MIINTFKAIWNKWEIIGGLLIIVMYGYLTGDLPIDSLGLYLLLAGVMKYGQ